VPVTLDLAGFGSVRRHGAVNLSRVEESVSRIGEP
jgi:hypothetical protein